MKYQIKDLTQEEVNSLRNQGIKVVLYGLNYKTNEYQYAIYTA